MDASIKKNDVGQEVGPAAAVMGKFLLWPGIYNLRSLKSLFGWRGSQSAQLGLQSTRPSPKECSTTVVICVSAAKLKEENKKYMIKKDIEEEESRFGSLDSGKLFMVQLLYIDFSGIHNNLE